MNIENGRVRADGIGIAYRRIVRASPDSGSETPTVPSATWTISGAATLLPD
ncbi:hypothetical protein [Candidatus Poriferisodalis sp.]|uniref:hypothetical protein n=1 Tax=Candidatus Poriferisodalis sp. TaxID=3101277 RepID=UPI003B022D1B